MARKPGTRTVGEFVLFDVYYEDGTQRSNRRVPASALGGLDGDEPAKADHRRAGRRDRGKIRPAARPDQEHPPRRRARAARHGQVAARGAAVIRGIYPRRLTRRRPARGRNARHAAMVEAQRQTAASRRCGKASSGVAPARSRARRARPERLARAGHHHHVAEAHALAANAASAARARSAATAPPATRSFRRRGRERAGMIDDAPHGSAQNAVSR